MPNLPPLVRTKDRRVCNAAIALQHRFEDGATMGPATGGLTAIKRLTDVLSTATTFLSLFQLELLIFKSIKESTLQIGGGASLFPHSQSLLALA